MKLRIESAPFVTARYGAALLFILVVGGCTDSAITLRDDKTGKEVRCGGEIVLPGRPSNAERCAKLMEEAGYKPVGQAR